MKSLNVKKIAAVGFGAAMIASAFAGAVQTDTTGLASFPFFSNGEPNVKLVIGSQAQPSDAVAAANIAAMIGNLAYTSKDITVLGVEGLSVTNSSTLNSNGASTDLEITTPGSNPNIAYQMKTYVEGYLDASSTDDRTNSMTSTILNNDGSSGGRKITNYETSLVNKVAVTDTTASKSYTEEERYFAYAQSSYDSNSRSIQAKNPQIAYEAQFTNPIQFCTDATPSSITTSGACDDQYETALHRVQIKLLGQNWVIQGMTTQGTGSSATIQSVTLGKEVQYKEFMQVGDSATAPSGISVKLADISNIATGQQFQPPVTFDVFDANGNKIDTVTLQEGGQEEYKGNGIVLKLWQAFTGLGGNNYAKVSIYSNELTLNDGSNVNTDNTQWTVSIVNGGTSYGPSISRIQLKRIVVDNLNPGDYVSLLQTPQLMKLTFNGLEQTTYDNLNLGTGSMNFPTSGSDISTQGQSYVRFVSDQSGAFQLGDTNTNTVYYIVSDNSAGASGQGTLFYQDQGYFKPYFSSDPSYQSYGMVSADNGATLTFSNNVCGGTNIITLGSNFTGGNWDFSNSGAILTADTNLNATCNLPANIKLLTLPNPTLRYQATMNYLPYTYGEKTVWIALNASGITASGDPEYVNDVIKVPEYITDDDNVQDYWLFDVGDGNANAPELTSTSGTAYFHYQNSGLNAYESGYISPRGSKGASLSSTSATINYATTLAHAIYSLTQATTNSSTNPNTQTNTYTTGQTALDDSGYTVIVKGINGAGAISSGGNIAGIDNLKPSLATADSVINLNTADTPLVVLDTNAPSNMPLIVVGGPMVNSIASQVLGIGAITSDTEAMVKVTGTSVVVAGYSASDTQTAANALISWLSANKDKIQGR